MDTTTTLPGGHFLIAESSPAATYIPEELGEEERMIMDMARDFVRNEVLPHADAIEKQEEGLTPRLLEKAGELGLLGTSIPEEFGGFGKDFNTNAALSVALGASQAFGVSLAAHTGIGTLPILYFGTEEQKARYLPKLATGEFKAAYCLTEPGSGSDALSARSKAEWSEEKQKFILSGQKMWITNGGFADIFIVFAQASGVPNHEGGFSAFIVEGSQAGVTRGEEERKMGIKGSSTRQIFFENVEVAPENALGELGKGHRIAFNILNIGRFKLCAMVTGGAKDCASTSIKYANERIQFKVPIASFGAIQHKLAEQAIQIFVSESATYRVSDMINTKIAELRESGQTYAEALMGAAEEYAIECALLKVLGSEMLDYVVDEMVQIHGGYGFSEEFPAARAYRDSRINRIFEGTNEINRLLSFDMMMRRAMRGQLDVLSAAKAVQGELMGIPDMGSRPTEPLAIVRAAVSGARKAMLMTAGAAAQKYGMALSNEQEVIMCCADMALEVLAMESALLRAEKLAERQAEHADRAAKIALTYTANAMERVAASGRTAIAAFADGDEQRMMLMGLKRFTKMDPVNTIGLRRELAAYLIARGDYGIA